MGRTLGRTPHSKANVISVRLTDETTERLDQLRAGISRSAYLRTLIMRQDYDGGEG